MLSIASCNFCKNLIFTLQTKKNLFSNESLNISEKKNTE